ncbi:hypothetical protein [Cytobacillus purgationiresistens]|uniref:Secreted protein n=1 Tax=Cytobacillus purgationiresistens TaxID=863449 RepID=A0ABU0AT36_9BACI|nr:hypothetical protein [Cytobacillus purgationiresistens]MDQ0273936.1 hypothetical protein [Cytobacillus purgationiresistens]
MKKLLLAGVLVLGISGASALSSGSLETAGIPTQHSITGKETVVAGIPTQHGLPVVPFGIPTQH